MIDMREGKYEEGLKQLLRVLRDEPLPRPVAYRGELIQSNGRVDRVTLLAEQAVPDADPDSVPEKLYCNLLPIEKLPRYLYVAPIARRLHQTRRDRKTSLPTKKELIEIVRMAQIEAGEEQPRTPAFRVVEDSVVTFHDLESPESPLAAIIDPNECEVYDVREFLMDEDDRRLVISLMNMAIARHMQRRGLEIDTTRSNRFFFPPSGDNQTHVIEWTPLKKRAQRTVAKPYLRNDAIDKWMHRACYIRAIFLASRFYIQLTPTIILTTDGHQVMGGPEVGRIVTRWLGQERNLHVLYHIRFWTSVLRRGPGPISIRAGDQWLEVATVPAFVQQAYGIEGDRKDLMGLLDREAPRIAQLEDESIDFSDDIQYVDMTDGEEPIEEETWDEGFEEDDAS
jgi:hypothetical protein